MDNTRVRPRPNVFSSNLEDLLFGDTDPDSPIDNLDMYSHIHDFPEAPYPVQTGRQNEVMRVSANVPPPNTYSLNLPAPPMPTPPPTHNLPSYRPEEYLQSDGMGYYPQSHTHNHYSSTTSPSAYASTLSTTMTPFPPPLAIPISAGTSFPTVNTPSPSLDAPSLSPLTPSPNQGYAQSPPSSTHSPPPPPTPSQLDSRKKSTAEIDQWVDFVSPSHTYRALYDQNHIPIRPILLRIRATADNLDYSDIDDAYILYRQNQFQLDIDFVGSLASYSTEDSEPFSIAQGGNLIPVEGLYFHIYAVKHMRGQNITEEIAEINQSTGPRNHKEFQTPGLVTVTNGRAMYSRLQFRNATGNNAKQQQNQPNANQQFYRIVISLLAKTGPNTYEFVASKISAPLVVRGQNPGKFGDAPSARKGPKPLPAIPIQPPTPLGPPPTPSIYAPPSPAPTQAKNTTSVYSQPPPSPQVFKQPPTPGIHQAKAARKRGQPEPPEVKMEGGDIWHRSDEQGESIYTREKVGINISRPQEALHVNGNLLVTGTIHHPSDQRVKKNIQAVDTTSSLSTIEKLKIYDYEFRHNKNPDDPDPLLRERGVLAQELQQVLPSAVKVLKNVTMPDGTVMDELLVVQDRALLFENLGATKELGGIVHKEQEKLHKMGDKFETHVKEDAVVTHRTLNSASRLLDFILAERQDVGNDNTNICCFMLVHSEKGFYGSLFGLGPAWTLYLLGFFVPPLWLFGAFFLFSPISGKKVAGALHLITLVLWGILIACIAAAKELGLVRFTIPFFVVMLGFVGLLVVGLTWRWKRTHRQFVSRQSRHIDAASQRVGLLHNESHARKAYSLEDGEQEGEEQTSEEIQEERAAHAHAPSHVIVQDPEEEAPEEDEERLVEKRGNGKKEKYARIPMDKLATPPVAVRAAQEKLAPAPAMKAPLPVAAVPASTRTVTTTTTTTSVSSSTTSSEAFSPQLSDAAHAQFAAKVPPEPYYAGKMATPVDSAMPNPWRVAVEQTS